MAKSKTQTYRVKEGCKKCKSPVYYYPVKLLLETREYTPKTEKTRIVTVQCTGELDEQGRKHTYDYVFTDDFEQI